MSRKLRNGALKPQKLLLLICPMNTSNMSQYRKIYTF